jgi:hypothetical protein
MTLYLMGKIGDKVKDDILQEKMDIFLEALKPYKKD